MTRRVTFSDILKGTRPAADELLDRPFSKPKKARKHTNVQAQKYSINPMWRRRPKERIAKENMPKPK